MASVCRREFLAGLGSVLAGGCAGSLLDRSAYGPAAADRPNILIVFTDDQRADALGIAGHPFLKTPNIDWLAENGVYCKNAFVPLSLCSPSRATLLTGQYPHVHGVMRNATQDVPYDGPYLPRLMQKAGYVTAMIGKWHQRRNRTDLAHPRGDEERPGFDYWAVFDSQGLYRNVELNINGTRVTQTGHTTDALTETFFDFLDRDRQTRPFFAILATKSAHGPFEPAKRFQGIYDNVEVPLVRPGERELAGKPLFVRNIVAREQDPASPRPPDVPRGLTDEKTFSTIVKGYCGTIAGVDENVGRIVDRLKALGLLNNTVIIFASDGGHYMGSHGLWDKRSCYEESIRIPLVVYDGRQTKGRGRRVDEMVVLTDIAPTVLHLAGAPIPETVQGRSLVPLMEGHPAGWRDSFLFEYSDTIEPSRLFPQEDMQGIRTRRWKYILSGDPEVPEELYDLKADPVERFNLINKREYMSVVEDMRRRLRSAQDETSMPKALRLHPPRHRDLRAETMYEVNAK